jgi:cysteine desulfurase
MSSIYLDYNSTTPVDLLVLETMLPWFSVNFGNAGSATHFWGRTAAAAVDEARGKVADLLRCEPGEIIFTSGATEAINLALRGAMHAFRSSGKHFITVTTEHKAVLDTAVALEEDGYECTRIGVDYAGRIDMDELNNAIRKDTILVAVMLANNETGVLQDAEAIGKICNRHNVLFFSDVTQFAGKQMLDVKECGMAMACVSSHKIYGPKGVGALYVSRKAPRVTLQAQITGGGQEKGLRSGTLNVPGIVGFGKACELAMQECWDTGSRLSSLRTIFEQLLEQKCGARINGSIRYRLPNTSNLRIPGLKAAALIAAVPTLGFSTGSACTSALPEPSHVLTAMGISPEQAAESFRISLGKYTKEEEIYLAVELISQVAASIKKL